MSEFATRSTFLSGAQRRFGEMVLPISGVKVRFRSLTEGELSQREAEALHRDEEGKLVTRDDELVNTRARLIILCLVDAEGNPLLSEADLEQVKLIDGADTGALYDRLREHCGIDARVKARSEKKRTAEESPPAAGTGPAGG